MSRDPLLYFLKRKTAARFAFLVQHTQRVVENAAFRVLGDAHRAEDVAQEVYMKALREDWDPRRIRSGVAWLVKTTVLLARTRLRSEVRRDAREQAARREVEPASMDPGDAAQVREAVFLLPEELRVCVELAYFGGMSAADVAQAVQVSRRAVNKRLERARAELAARLDGGALACVLPAFGLAGALPQMPREGSEARCARWTELAKREAHLVSGGFSPRWIAAAVTLLLVGGAATTIALRASDGRDDPAPVRATARGSDDASDAAPARAPGLITTGREDAAAKAPSPPPASKDGTGAGTSPRGKHAGTFSLSVRIVDDDGALVRRGTVHLAASTVDDKLRLMRISLDKGAKDLMEFSALLEPMDLAERNPLVVADLPASLEGMGFHVVANVPGLGLAGPSPRLTVRAGQREDVTLRLVPARAVEIEVRDAETGAWIEGVSVMSETELERRDLTGLDTGSGPGRAVTDSAGRCTLTGLGRGTHVLELRNPGYERATRTLAADATQLTVALRRSRGGGTVEVVVLDPQGVPVPDMPLDVIVKGARRPPQKTDVRGRAVYRHLPAGFFTVMVDADAWIKLAGRVGKSLTDGVQMRVFELEKDGERIIELGFPAASGSLRIEVTHESGGEVGGRLVRLIGAKIRQGKTDAGGVCQFDELPEGRYYIELTHGTEWTWHSPPVQDRKQIVHRVTVGEHTVRGRVVLGGEGAKARVSLGGDRDADVLTDEEGRFVFPGLPRGAYTLTASMPGASRFAAPRVVQVGADASDPIELVLIRGGTLRVRLDEAAVAAQARVTAKRDGEEAVAFERTSEEPVWTCGPLVPGTYEVVIASGGATTRRTATVREGEVTDVDQ